MADKIPIIGEKKYSYEGFFDMKGTYEAIKDFLENTRHYDLTEQDYKEKNVSGDREIVSKNIAEQYFTDYYKIVMKFTLEMKGKDIEVEMEGKKKVLTQGVAYLTINTYIEPDYLEKSSSSPLMTFVTKVYDKYFGKDDFTKVVGSMSNDVGQMITLFKQQVNSKTL